MTEPNFNNGIASQGDPSTPTPPPQPALPKELPFTATPSTGIKTMPHSKSELARPVSPIPTIEVSPVVPPAPSTLDRALAHGEPIDMPSVLDGELAIKPFPKVETGHSEIQSPSGDRISKSQEPAPSIEILKINVVSKTTDDAQKQSAIRTLEGDIAQTVRGQGLSVADIALAEQKRKAITTSEEIPEPPKESLGTWWVLGTILFLLLGGAVVAGVLYLRPGTDVPLVETPEQAQFPADARATIDVTGMTFDNFTAKIKESLLADAPLGTIRSVSLAQKMGTTTDTLTPISNGAFFALIKSRAPSRLVRSLEDSFVFGVATVDRPTAFLMFKTNSFETTFAGMLEWEPFIAEDVPFITKEIVLPPAPEPIVVATSTNGTSTIPTASSTPIVAPPPPESEIGTFLDIVVKNEDVRALTLSDGTVRLLYSFPDKNTLIIAENKEALTLILERLSSARFTR